VHHCDFPVADQVLVDERLMSEMELAIEVASLGRSARGLGGIKLRQPLGEAVVAGPFGGREDPLGPLAGLVLDELNVKELRFTEDASELLTYVLKPDPRVLGPKYGAKLSRVQKAVAGLDARESARRLLGGEALSLELDGETIHLAPGEISVDTQAREGYAVSQEGDYVVSVDLRLTKDLIEEGLAREVVRRIQNLRKEADFRIEDKIRTYYEGDPELSKVMQGQADYIMQETLSEELVEAAGPQGSHTGVFEIDGKKITFYLLPVSGEAGPG